MDLVNKYRPTKLSQVIGQKATVTVLRGVLKRKEEINPVSLFCGPHSTGKTTLAWILALYTNCKKPTEKGEACRKCESCKNIIKAIQTGTDGRSVIEKPVSERGIDAIRSLQSQAKHRCQDRYRWFILDEVHNLTPAAFDAALRLFEKPPRQTRFILCTTEPEALKRTIMSRNFVFKLKAIPPQITAQQLLWPICQREKFTGISQKNVKDIALKVNGYPRDALNLLSQWVAAVEGGATPEDAPAVIGKLPAASTHQAIEKYVSNVLTGRPASCMQALQYADSPTYFVDRTIEILCEVLHRWTTKNKISSPRMDMVMEEVLPELPGAPPVAQLGEVLEIMLNAQDRIKEYRCNGNAVLDAATLRAVRITKKWYRG